MSAAMYARRRLGSLTTIKPAVKSLPRLLLLLIGVLLLHIPSSVALFASTSQATTIISSPPRASSPRSKTYRTSHQNQLLSNPTQRQGQSSPIAASPSTTSLASSSKGSSDEQSSSDEAIPSPTNPSEQTQSSTPGPINKRAMTLALSLAYFTVMGAKCALPSVLALLTSDPSAGGLIFPSNTSPSQAMAQLLTLSTLAIAAGKLVLGPIIDTYSGGVFLQWTLAVLTTLFGFLAVGPRHFGGFFAAWMGIDFIFSSCWASCINAIHQYFAPSEWANLISHLATGARAGNALAFLAFSAVLTACTNYPTWIQRVPSLPWRMVFALSALAQLLPLGMLMKYAKPTKKLSPEMNSSRLSKQSSTSSRTSLRQSLRLAWKQAHRLDFWMHFVSRSVLMVFASFLLFVPTCMVHVFGATSSFASQTGSAYALGCLLAVTGVSRIYNHVVQKSKWHKWTAITTLTGLAATSSGLFWAHCANLVTLSPTTACALFFLWGCAMAIPFYIPPSLYALERGGTECSATIMDLFDIGGFGLLASFNGYVASISGATNPLKWVPTFVITTVCALLSLVSLGVAVFQEDWGDPSEESWSKSPTTT